LVTSFEQELSVQQELQKVMSKFWSVSFCLIISINHYYRVGRFSLTANVSGLCDGGAIEAQIFNFAQKLNRRTAVELCSFAPLLQNPC
jgi:hypothetical protein